MSWLEDEEKTREEEVKKWKIRPGDFVNLRSWFGDVWAEVEKTYDDESPFIVIYRNNDKYKTDMVLYSNIRKLCRKENISKIETCRKITKRGTIAEIYPMKPGAYNFQGDEHITEDW